MEATEICGLLWRVLAEQSTAVSLPTLGELSGLSRYQVSLGIAKLRSNNLLLITTSSPDGSLSTGAPSADPPSDPARLDSARLNPTQDLFRLKLSLNSLEWAQAVEIGVDFDALETYATLLQASMAEVVALAESGALAVERDRQHQAKISARQQALQGKVNSRLAETELAGLLGDINYLVDHPEAFALVPTDTPDDVTAMQRSLQLMKQEAEGALDGLRHSLLATVH